MGIAPVFHVFTFDWHWGFFSFYYDIADSALWPSTWLVFAQILTLLVILHMSVQHFYSFITLTHNKPLLNVSAIVIPDTNY